MIALPLIVVAALQTAPPPQRFEVASIKSCKEEPNTSGQRRQEIFTALEEQLGLKLERTRGPREFLVIVRVERPDPD